MHGLSTEQFPVSAFVGSSKNLKDPQVGAANLARARNSLHAAGTLSTPSALASFARTFAMSVSVLHKSQGSEETDLVSGTTGHSTVLAGEWQYDVQRYLT